MLIELQLFSSTEFSFYSYSFHSRDATTSELDDIDKMDDRTCPHQAADSVTKQQQKMVYSEEALHFLEVSPQKNRK